MTIYVKVKNVYGRSLVYPSCNISEKFARLIGVKTFNDNHLDLIIALGYRILEDHKMGARLASHTALINSIVKGE